MRSQPHENGSTPPDELAHRIAAVLGGRPLGIVEVAGDPDLAGKLGAELGTFVAEDEAPNPAVVVDATGSPHVVRSALQRLADHGLLILTVTLRGSLGQLNYYEDLHRRGLTVIGI